MFIAGAASRMRGFRLAFLHCSLRRSRGPRILGQPDRETVVPARGRNAFIAADVFSRKSGASPATTASYAKSPHGPSATGTAPPLFLFDVKRWRTIRNAADQRPEAIAAAEPGWRRFPEALRLIL